ncbi:E3 ubiquitin-protein ligase TRIM33-like isoform X2 [Melanaphis sacchari]|uniref:E3 ubiquitin-protein ligase TRIM33-like isoform X2 n=1 Tax=Melanaphis sacchari TaxID=742174 RepID=UPI000DC14C51|nr:E3 ubiquitin-protein ligase TRIM33-like isoform X2 [Melanaphis sacchari]
MNPGNKNIDLWSIEKCVFCNGRLEKNSKILNCLHGICKDCVPEDVTDSGILCKCGIVTISELISYPIVSSVESTVEKCFEQNCDEIANKICISCNSLYCKSCSKIHLNINQDHKPILMKTYPLKEEFIPCPECTEKCIEVYCLRCSKMICPLCHLNKHRSHGFKILKTMADETKLKLNMDLLKVRKNNIFLDSLNEKLSQDIENLQFQKDQINEKINEAMNLLYQEIYKRSLELKTSLEIHFTDLVGKIIINKEVLNDFKKENEYYFNLTNSIIDNNKTFDIVKISKNVTDKMTLSRSYIDNMPREIVSFNASLEYNNHEQSIRECIEKFRGIGNITSTPVVSLPDYRIMVNNAQQPLRKNQPLNSTPIMEEIKPEIEDIKEEIEEVEEMEENNLFNLFSQSDSDSSEYEPLLNCSCCNQWTVDELLNCKGCNRFYHNDCHIPLIDKELVPDNPLLNTWTCTLCQDISSHVEVLLQKDVTAYFVSGHSEQKLIERILMMLYCQNEDSEHYRECLNRATYPHYYEIVEEPISLNDVKERFVSTSSYISLIDILKDIHKVFKNGMDYFDMNDPYYKSAYELQLSFHGMVTLWLPKIDLESLDV